MLADKLRAATSSPIQYVGGYTEGFAGTTSDKIITFGGSLTGGIASSASEDDLVLVWFGTGSDSDENLVVAGYTQIIELFSPDTYDTNLAVAYKFMGAVPDTTVTLTGGTLADADAGAVVIQVFRNVDLASPLDVTTQTALTTGSVEANPPAITPTTPGAFVVAGGAGGHIAGTQTYSSLSLTDFISVGRADTYDVTIGAGYYQWISGAFNPIAFSFSGTDSGNYSAAAVTLALRPA